MKSSEKIKILKKVLNKKNYDIARDLELNLTTIANISSGKNGFTDVTARKFYEVYNVNPSWLLFDQGRMFSNPQEEVYVEKFRQLDKRDKAIISNLLDSMTYHYNHYIPTKIEAMEQEFSSIPLLSKIAAGDPILTLPTTINDKHDIIITNIPKRKKESFYALKIKGNSMIEHRIHDGDIVIINKEAQVYSGCIAVCLIDKEVSTLKQVLFHSKSRIELKPFNKDMESIWLSNKNDLLTQGVLHQTIIQN